MKKIDPEQEIKQLEARVAELESMELKVHRAEKGMAENVRLYHTLVESIQEGLIVLDPDENIIFANPYFCELVGRPRDHVIGLNIRELVSPEDYERLRRETARRRKGEPSRYEMKIRRQDGEERNLMIATASWLNDQGEFQGSFEGILDVTEQKTAEEKIRASEEKYRAVMEQSGDPILIVDLQTKRVLEANSALRNLLGYTPEEMDELNIYDITDGIAMDVGREIDEIFKNRRSFLGERTYRRKDGTMIQIWMSSSIVAYRGQKVLCIVARDITQQKHIQEELKKSVRTLTKTLEGVTSMISAIIKTKDPYTADHQLRVSQLACAIAEEMGLEAERIEGLRTAALMHDLGKIYLPAELLAKPDALNETEMKLFKNHPQDGYNILKKITFPWPVPQIVLQHHERIDGSGYPLGISGAEIITESRILGIADVVEAMVYFRPYRPARGVSEALKEIGMFKGSLYDAEAVKVCIRLFNQKGFKFED